MSAILSLLAGAVLACDAPTVATALPAADSSYRQLFEGGKDFTAFLAAAEKRKEQWERNYRMAVLPDALVSRARAASGPWKLLVVAVDGCSDSVNTIPYLARLTSQLMGVELRIIGSDVGRGIMETHRTPDGRGATPTVLLLDATYEEKGCWVERPSELQGWIAGQKGKLADSEIFDRKMKWYDDNAGQATLDELVTMLEHAARHEPACPASR